MNDERGVAMASPGSDVTLRPSAIGLREVLFQSITHMAPGVGVAFAIIVGAFFAGGALPLAVLLAVAGCALTAVSLGQLSKHLPGAGSFYTYAANALHPSVGFLAGWVYAFGEITGFPLCIVLLGVIVPGAIGVSDNTWWIWVAIGSLIVFTLGYFGIRVSTRTGTALGAFEILVFLALGVTLIAKAGSANTIHAFGTKFANIKGFSGYSGVFAGLVYSIFAFIGFEAAAPLAEESRDPKRLIGLAAVLSAVLIGLYYVVITYGATVFFGPTRMAQFPSFGGGNPYQQLAHQVWGWGWVFVFLALINSSVACSNAVNNAVTRTFYALGRIRVFPQALASVHPKWRSPHVSVITVFVISVASWMWLGFQYDPFTAFAVLGTAITLVAVAIYILINISCFAYYIRFRRDEFNPVTHLIVPILGIGLFVPAFLTAAGVTAFKFVSPLPHPLSYVGPVLGGWLVLGVIYMLYLYQRHPERIAETKRVFEEEGPVETVTATT
jgi:amino acid transporter